MALNHPSPQTGVPRDDVHNVVEAMLLDTSVKWVSIVYEKTTGGEDQFAVTPYTADPTSG